MSKFPLTLTLVLSMYGSVLFAQKPTPADQVLKNAKAQAAQEHKLILVVFTASWCGPCHQFDDFLSAPETRQILEKYFVTAKLHVAERLGKRPELDSPGGEELDVKLGGANAEGQIAGVPFIVFLDARGKPIVNSNRPVAGHAGGENIGYPSEPEEIDWFMAMLKKAVPMMTADESRTIDEWLRKASAN
jgi:thioredoxin-related protein